MDRDLDARLCERILARDERALEEAISVFGGMVQGVAIRVIGEPAMAEEVAQDTFLALWRRPGAYDPERGSLGSFLVGIARNKAVDLVRHEESLRRTRRALMAEVESAPEPPEGFAGEVEERHEVAGALAALTPLQREALVLAYFGGRTYREVAIELGIPEGTAKTRLRDGLIKLREALGTSPGM